MNLKVIFEKQIKLDETLHNNVINPNEKNLREELYKKFKEENIEFLKLEKGDKIVQI